MVVVVSRPAVVAAPSPVHAAATSTTASTTLRLMTGTVRPDAAVPSVFEPRFGQAQPARWRRIPTLPGVKINVVTMFPAYFDGPLQTSIVARAIQDGALDIHVLDLREHGIGRHRQLDDTPFGGGPGMVMMVEPLARALEPLAGTRRVLLTPSGEPMTQPTLDAWAGLDEVTFVCGRFEGVDQRVIDGYIDQEVSLGDYVLAGGEVAAAAAIEGVARLLPGVVGNPESTMSESFRQGLLEEPVYTRPADFEGARVPEVLSSGDHGRIEEWRAEERVRRTRERRPDLLSNGEESDS